MLSPHFASYRQLGEFMGLRGMGLNRFRLHILGLQLLGATAAALFTACSAGSGKLQTLGYSFNTKPTNYTAQVNFCTDVATSQVNPVKMIIILDHSGSNQKNYIFNPDGTARLECSLADFDELTSLATDPSGFTRYGAKGTPNTLLDFLGNLQQTNPPQYYFSLIDFATSPWAPTYNAGVSTCTNVNPANTYPSFTSNLDNFYENVLADAHCTPSPSPSTSPSASPAPQVSPSPSSAAIPLDSGWTDFVLALRAAENLITNDINANSGAAADYVIVFMTDGSPITSISGSADSDFNISSLPDPTALTTPQGCGFTSTPAPAYYFNKETETSILLEIDAITALASNTAAVGGINLYTVYYYHPGNADPTAQQLLSNMAVKGNGFFLNVVSGNPVDYRQFQPLSKLVKYTLADVFVTNSSVAWWTDGTLHANTTLDGLPDDVEKAWCMSAPGSPCAIQNGVSNFVKYLLRNQGNTTAYSGNPCPSLAPTVGTNGALTYRSTSPDGLNDCEKILLQDTIEPIQPDSNGDLIPDWLELKNGLPFQYGVSSPVNSPNIDGYTDYQKVKFSLPTMLSLDQFKNPQPSVYNLVQTSSTSVQDCYNLTVSNLPTIGANNTIRVDVVLKTNITNNSQSYRYKVGHKAFPTGSSVVKFEDWNNSTEQSLSPPTWKTWP